MALASHRSTLTKLTHNLSGWASAHPVSFEGPSHDPDIERGRTAEERGTGFYDPEAKRLGWDGEEVEQVQSFRITNLRYAHNGRPAIARVYGPVGVEQTEVPAGLVNTLVQQTKLGAIREVANAGCLDIWPGEPVLEINTWLGSVITTPNRVKQPNGPDFPFNTWYCTDYADANETRTTLIEQPDAPGMTVYHYVFDGELKRVGFGAVMADNAVPRLTVYERTATGQSA
jgi:hypothetical protein